jgi:meiosis induction protein kinase IME2/SME1
MVVNQASGPNPPSQSEYSDLDKALQNVRYSLDASAQLANTSKTSSRVAGNPVLKRHHSLPHGQEARSSEHSPSGGPISSRTRRALQKQSNPSNRYETPNEEEELLDEDLTSAHKAAKRLDRHAQSGADTHKSSTTSVQTVRPSVQQSSSNLGPSASYLTPSPSANRNGVSFGQNEYTTPTKPVDINKIRNNKEEITSKWPTPPYEENDWATAAAASIFATQARYR